MKRWIVSSIETGETCDGKPRVLAICTTKDEAKAYVQNDIEEWIDRNATEGVEADFDKMRAWFDYDTNDGCDWNIEEIEIPIPDACIKMAERILVDNGIEADEAEIVLQAIGYALLGTELYGKKA